MKVSTIIFIQAEHIATLCLSIINVAEEKCPSLLPRAHYISEKFTSTFKLFSHCHSLYNSKFLTTEQIDSLGQHQIYTHTPLKYTYMYILIADVHIQTFLQHYRTEHPHATVTPKLHFLEDHMVPWMRKWGVSVLE